MFYSDDPALDEIRYTASLERKARELPTCDCCGTPIRDSSYVVFAGSLLCHGCVRANTVTLTEDDYD